MLVNLINTILIACSMAVNATNFNSVEKPKRNNAIQTINETVEFDKQSYYRLGVRYDEEADIYEDYQKFTLENKVNYFNTYLNITNTAYTIQTVTHVKNLNIWEQKSMSYTLLQLTNYYNQVMTYNITLTETIESTTQYGTRTIYAYNVDETMANYINMTLNASTRTALENYKATLTNENVIFYQQDRLEPIPSQNNKYTFTDTTTEIQTQERETKYIMFYTEIQLDQASTSTMGLNTVDNLIFSGSIVIPDNTGDIIDVPGIMLTVLTLPFSFISQAFDLTIFPNTPYQINFSNLFRTIIAIFVLLWIIKKIFK